MTGNDRSSESLGVISVVVPVFKTAEYLTSCLASLAAQERVTLEVIVVDDGSPDAPESHVDNFRRQCSGLSVKFIKLPANRGVSFARNVGMDAATGDFIAFVDPDDELEPAMFRTMLEKLRVADTDAAVCGYRLIEGQRTSSFPVRSTTAVGTGAETFALMCQGRVASSVCTSLFRASAIRSARFRENVRFEDFIFLAELLPQVESVAHVPDCLYRYIRRAGSETGRLRPSLADLFVGLEAARRSLQFVPLTQRRRLNDIVTVSLMRTIFHQIFAFGEGESFVPPLKRRARKELTPKIAWRLFVQGPRMLGLSALMLQATPAVYGFAYRALRNAKFVVSNSGARS